LSLIIWRHPLNVPEELFAKEVVQTLFVFQLLEPYFSTKCDEETVLPLFHEAYLERRVANEPVDGFQPLVQIRRTAQQLWLKGTDGRSISDYIKELSVLVIREIRGRTDVLWKTNEARNIEDEFEKGVYIAALYTQNMPVVANWLSRGNSAAQFCWLFGTARSHAAKFGDGHLLAAVMHGSPKDWSQMLRREMLIAVCEAGRAGMAQFVFEFDTTRNPWDISSQKRPRYAYLNNYALASMHTPSRAVFEYLMRIRRTHCVDKTFGPKEYTTFLGYCAWKGWAEMAEHYISLGASVDGLGPPIRFWKTPPRMIVFACKGGYADIVAVLLKHGADTSRPALEVAARYGHLDIVRMLLKHGAEFGEAVREAAMKGYKDILVELLNHGAVVGDDQPSLLVHSIGHEDKAIFRLLVEGGCEANDPTVVTECLQLAEREGLDSMAEFLRQEKWKVAPQAT
jgi:hypothetical protein